VSGDSGSGRSAQHRPQPSGRTAPGAPARDPTEVKPPPPGSGAVTEAGVGGEPPDRPRRILALAAAAVVAVAAGALSVWAYLHSQPSEAPAPPYVTVTVDSSARVGIIGYKMDRVHGRAEMDIWVELAGAGNAANGLVTVSQPNTKRFLHCPTLACVMLRQASTATQAQPLIFKQTRGFTTLIAEAQFPANDFGYAVNGVTAVAVIPEVFYRGPAGTPTLETEYDIPSASSYDWSSDPTQFANSSQAVWNEPVTGGEAPGRAAVGIDHANEAKAGRWLFLAGALIGVATGALLWAIQELLRGSDGKRRRSGYTPEPASECARPHSAH